jgi:hypothetical protein
MITEFDTARAMDDQSIYEHTLENHASRLERENRQLKSRVRILESALEKIRMTAIAGVDQ